MKKLLSLLLLSLSFNVHSETATATICDGEYALCAASTGIATGNDITVLGVDGTSQTYPEIAVKCPVIKGKAIAGLNSGTMGNSCTPPSKDQVYSLFSFDQSYPQEANDFSHKPADMTPVYQTCPASLNLGKQISQCWSMVCTYDKERTNGTKTATCLCPAGEGLLGGALPSNIAFLTPAGGGDPSACYLHPVALPLEKPSNK